MLPDRVSNPGPLTYESGALPIALREIVLTSFIMIGSYKLVTYESGALPIALREIVLTKVS